MARFPAPITVIAGMTLSRVPIDGYYMLFTQSKNNQNGASIMYQSFWLLLMGYLPFQTIIQCSLLYVSKM
jgi:hypothetical protein